MSTLNVIGSVLIAISAAVWGGIYLTAGEPSTFSNMVLLIGVALGGTCFALQWAESYTH